MTVITFRADAEAERLLAELAAPGETRSDTLRRAIHDASVLARRERMRREAVTLAADADDVAEARAVMADLDSLDDADAW